jgi:hypothetical protein
MTEQTVAVRRAFLPKHHVFRREIKQIEEQLALTRANSVEDSLLAILFL